MNSDPRAVDVDAAMAVVLDDLEEDLTEILGARPKLISVRFERQRAMVPRDPREKLAEALEAAVHSEMVSLCRIEVWSERIVSPGGLLVVAARGLDDAVEDMLRWARKTEKR